MAWTRRHDLLPSDWKAVAEVGTDCNHTINARPAERAGDG